MRALVLEYTVLHFNTSKDWFGSLGRMKAALALASLVLSSKCTAP